MPENIQEQIDLMNPLVKQAMVIRFRLYSRLRDEGEKVRPTWKEVLTASGVRHAPRIQLTTEIQGKDGETTPVTIMARQNDDPSAFVDDGIEIHLNGRIIILLSTKVMTEDPKTVPPIEDIQLASQIYDSLGPAKQKEAAKQ